jgi:uncharacterized membrane protein YraQ (UPF0718 family)
MKRRMDASLWILLGCATLALAAAFAKDTSLPWQGLQASGRLLRSVWLELALGFLLAGLIEVLIPAATISRWLGSERPGHGILVGWVAGLAMPGGPYLFFPIAAKLFDSGASPGALIAFLTAKTLVSPVRMLTYEAPLLGWPLTLARFIPGVLLPPLMGWLGQWLYFLLKPK